MFATLSTYLASFEFLSLSGKKKGELLVRSKKFFCLSVCGVIAILCWSTDMVALRVSYVDLVRAPNLAVCHACFEEEE